jgi:hypothetical protein
VPGVVVTVLGANGGKGEPARLEALQAASDPSGGRSAPGRLVLSLRGCSAAKDPDRFIATGEDLLVDVFVAGDHGLGREPLLHPGPHRVGVELT